jgi:hypothetical protein
MFLNGHKNAKKEPEGLQNRAHELNRFLCFVPGLQVHFSALCEAAER